MSNVFLQLHKIEEFLACRLDQKQCNKFIHMEAHLEF